MNSRFMQNRRAMLDLRMSKIESVLRDSKDPFVRDLIKRLGNEGALEVLFHYLNKAPLSNSHYSHMSKTTKALINNVVTITTQGGGGKKFRIAIPTAELATNKVGEAIALVLEASNKDVQTAFTSTLKSTLLAFAVKEGKLQASWGHLLNEEQAKAGSAMQWPTKAQWSELSNVIKTISGLKDGDEISPKVYNSYLPVHAGLLIAIGGETAPYTGEDTTREATLDAVEAILTDTPPEGTDEPVDAAEAAKAIAEATGTTVEKKPVEKTGKNQQKSVAPAPKTEKSTEQLPAAVGNNQILEMFQKTAASLQARMKSVASQEDSLEKIAAQVAEIRSTIANERIQLAADFELFTTAASEMFSATPTSLPAGESTSTSEVEPEPEEADYV